ncbi:MAG: hypothetical protein U0232_22620 [Thermomicrobiales bacterium]
MTAKWRLGIGIVATILLVVGLVPDWGGARAAAADDYNVSNQSKTTQQSLGISPDGKKICAVWTQFDVPTPQVFFRLYDANAKSWAPPLSGPPFQVSSAGDSNRPRCAVDAAGYAHVVWQQKHREGDTVTGQLDVAYRRLAAGADAGNGSAWSGIEGIANNRSSADIEAVENAPGGKVWLVVRRFQEGGSSALELRSWEPNSGWSGPKSRDTGGQADSPRIATDLQGFVHIVFRNGGSSGISYTYLGPDGGFGPQTSVPNGTNAGAVDIAADRGNGDVHIVYAKDFTKLYYAKKSYNSGFSLKQIDEGSGQVDEPGITWSANGLLNVTYSNGKNAEVDRKTSANGGNDWSDREVFSAPSGGVSAPWLVADRAGVGYVAYNRRSAGDVFLATSATAPSPSPSPSPTPPPSAATPPDVPGYPSTCFAETGFCVRGLFLAYWQAHGGLAINGFPLSDEFPVYLEDGKAYTVQYFERVRMEYHPENAEPFQVLLGQFGRRLHPADPAVAEIPGATYFAETGHNVTRAEFVAYWQSNGGLAQFGFPLSEEFVETLENGQQYSVQYFERARFEWHPENGEPYKVLLGQFGRRILGETPR